MILQAHQQGRKRALMRTSKVPSQALIHRVEKQSKPYLTHQVLPGNLAEADNQFRQCLCNIRCGILLVLFETSSPH